MKVLPVIMILFIPLGSFAKIDFIRSYQKALKLAKEQDKLVFVDFTATWCKPCKMLERETFALDSIGEFFNENFINLKVDSDKKKSIFKKYGVNSMPTMLFVDGDGSVVSEMVYRDPHRFMQASRDVIEQYNSIQKTVGTIAVATDHASIEQMIEESAYLLDKPAFERLINEVHDISDVHRSYVQRYII